MIEAILTTREIRWWRVLWGRLTKPREKRVRLRRWSSETARVGLRIWSEVVHRSRAELLYNPSNGESFAVLHEKSHSVYLFLEAHRLRVINGTIGYDVTLTPSEMAWAEQVFFREVHKRRSALKNNVMSSVTASLQHLEEKIKKQS